MMKRIGESDISRIVEMFQKQTLTHQAWTEAVRDQEIRVKALQVCVLDSSDVIAKDFETQAEDE